MDNLQQSSAQLAEQLQRKAEEVQQKKKGAPACAHMLTVAHGAYLAFGMKESTAHVPDSWSSRSPDEEFTSG